MQVDLVVGRVCVPCRGQEATTTGRMVHVIFGPQGRTILLLLLESCFLCDILLVKISIHEEHIVVKNGGRGRGTFAHRVDPVIADARVEVLLLQSLLGILYF